MKLTILASLLPMIVACASSVPEAVATTAAQAGVQQQRQSLGRSDHGNPELPVPGVVELAQGGAVSAVGWGDAADSARPLHADEALLGEHSGTSGPGSIPGVGITLTASEITALALSVSGDAEFAAFITPVTFCESSNRPAEEGDALERGLTMMSPVHRPWLLTLGEGFAWERQYEPATNLRSAFALWIRDGASPWESTRRCWG